MWFEGSRCACGVFPCRSLAGRCARLNSLSSTTRLIQRSTRGLCELAWIHQGCMYIMRHNQVFLLFGIVTREMKRTMRLRNSRRGCLLPSEFCCSFAVMSKVHTGVSWQCASLPDSPSSLAFPSPLLCFLLRSETKSLTQEVDSVRSQLTELQASCDSKE